MANRPRPKPRLQSSDFRPIARLVLVLLSALALLLLAPLGVILLWGPTQHSLAVGSVSPVQIGLVLVPAAAAVAGWGLHLTGRERAAIAVAAPASVLALAMMAGFIGMTS